MSSKPSMGLGRPWTELKPALRPETLAALDKAYGPSHRLTTPVQDVAVSLFMSNKDVAVQACTGSGKTLAFLIPTLEILQRKEGGLRSNQVGALILLPTRELAQQVNEVALKLVEHFPQFTVALLIGGTDINSDMAKFCKQGGSIVIGTPGRVDDMMQRLPREFNVRELEVLVLDEADRLLEMGFENTVNTIIGRLPKQRRTGLFSATMEGGVKELVRAGLRNPMRVQVDVQSNTTNPQQSTPSSLDNYYITCESDQKLTHFAEFLAKHKTKKFIVFFLTCACVDYFGRLMEVLPAFKERSASVITLHGKMKHNRRQETYKKFVDLDNGVLVCTDVAARGLDLPDVDWIVQFDPPQDASMFVHRVGRTARMGRQGSSLIYLLPNEDAYIGFLEVRKVPMKELSIEDTCSSKSLLPVAKRYISKDRDLFEKSSRAFVSFVRAYKEHQCQFIFRFQQLNLGRLATAFSLLKLPKMPEIPDGRHIDFEPTEIDTEAIKFKDKQREKQRQSNLVVRKETNRVKKQERLEKERGLKKFKDEEPIAAGKKEGKKVKKDASSEDESEEDDYGLEIRMMKKLKQGKITQKEFDRAVGDCEDSVASADESASDEGNAMDKGAEDASASVNDASSSGSDEEQPPAKKARTTGRDMERARPALPKHLKGVAFAQNKALKERRQFRREKKTRKRAFIAKKKVDAAFAK